MITTRYKSRPQEIQYVDVIQWTGANIFDCRKFIGDQFYSEVFTHDDKHQILVNIPGGGEHGIIDVGDYILKCEHGHLGCFDATTFHQDYEIDGSLDTENDPIGG